MPTRALLGGGSSGAAPAAVLGGSNTTSSTFARLSPVLLTRAIHFPGGDVVPQDVVAGPPRSSQEGFAPHVPNKKEGLVLPPNRKSGPTVQKTAPLEPMTLQGGLNSFTAAVDKTRTEQLLLQRRVRAAPRASVEPLCSSGSDFGGHPAIPPGRVPLAGMMPLAGMIQPGSKWRAQEMGGAGTLTDSFIFREGGRPVEDKPCLRGGALRGCPRTAVERPSAKSPLRSTTDNRARFRPASRRNLHSVLQEMVGQAYPQPRPQGGGNVSSSVGMWSG